MPRQLLEEMNDHLNENDPKDGILIRLRGYYFYYNNPTEVSHTVLVHRDTCGHCCFGAGHNNNAEPGRNGAWVGPFSTPEQAEEFAARHFPHHRGGINRCGCV
jgi:hypothetical protein